MPYAELGFRVEIGFSDLSGFSPPFFVGRFLPFRVVFCGVFESFLMARVVREPTKSRIP